MCKFTIELETYFIQVFQANYVCIDHIISEIIEKNVFWNELSYSNTYFLKQFIKKHKKNWKNGISQISAAISWPFGTYFENFFLQFLVLIDKVSSYCSETY